MSDEAVNAYDPDSTPNDLTSEIGMDSVVLNEAPFTPGNGELFTDEDGKPRHVAPREDGKPVGIKMPDKEDSA